MSLIAAFLWNKSPRTSISTMIFDEDNLTLLLPPKIEYFPKTYLAFRDSAERSIKHFFSQIAHYQRSTKKPVIVEFRIVFNSYDVPYRAPSKESLFIFRYFNKQLEMAMDELKDIKLRPQLRKRLAGKPLIQFKKVLRSLYLVSRKKQSGFEYQLWAVALHATSKTYMGKLKKLRKKLLAAMWESSVASKH